jgi:sulfite exporter TauE/SafE
LFLIGLLNGLLPCGPVYAAAAGALATSNLWTGALFMFAFGLGTMPMLSAISIIGNRIGIELRKKLARLVPVTIVVIGLLFILRGMSLGIPFISPPDKKLHVPEKMEMMSPMNHSAH